MEDLKKLNDNIKDLRIRLRTENINSSSDLISLKDMVKDPEDYMAFVFLLDRFETDKELTRLTLEDLIEFTGNFNSNLLDRISFSTKPNRKHKTYFSMENIKVIAAMCVALGLIVGIARSEYLIEGILSYYGIKIEKSAKVKIPGDNNE